MDYVHAFDRIAGFFAGNPTDPQAWAGAIAGAQRMSRRRDEVEDVLEAQQGQRGAPARAVESARLLRDPKTVAVVTGQQAGLFGGPLFTLLKAATAIRLARDVTAKHGVAAVPIFWIDAEDHDWDEVKSCGLLDPDLQLVQASLDSPVGANERPVGWIALDQSAAGAVEALEAALPPSEYTPDLVARLKAAYQPGEPMAGSFARWMESVLGPAGLVVFDASDPAAKPLVADLFVREVEQAGATSRCAAAAGERLAALGYHAQVAPSDQSLALFELDGVRTPIRHQDGQFTIGSRTLTRGALIDAIRLTPERFSPNVLLRPLVQDTLFPTVCYVAGPNELAYLGQLKDVYQAFGVPMPLMYQRLSATIVDSNAMRFLSRSDVAFEALRARDEAALNQLLSAQLPASVDRAMQEAAQGLQDRMEALARAVMQIDATLEGAARSALGRMQDDLRKLQGKVIQAAKRKDDTLRRQFTHAQAQAFPGGEPQERAIGFVYFLNKFGPSLLDRLEEELPLDMGTHWVIAL